MGEFIVINDIGVTPDVGGCSLQIRIGVNNVFLNPDGSVGHGLSAWLIPYPRNKNYNLKFKPIYVLNGQVFDVFLHNSKKVRWMQNIRAFVKYDIYTGPDAIIATKLLGLGCAVNQENIEWYQKIHLNKDFDNNLRYLKKSVDYGFKELIKTINHIWGDKE